MKREKPMPSEIKRINRQNIYHLLREKGPLTKQEIVLNLQLSLPTVTQNLVELEEKGLINSSGRRGNTGGRDAAAYSCVNDLKAAVGLDITKHHVKAVVVDLSGKVIEILREKVIFSLSDEYFRRLAEIVDIVLKKSGMENRVLGVGIAVPGLVSEDGKEVVYGEILNFKGTRCEEFAKYMPYPAILYNDANAAGFAEVWMSPVIENAFYICLSNYVGGAVLIDKKVYCGENQRSGEIGHITIEQAGPKCYCGQNGCFEVYCNARVLSDMTNGNLNEFFIQLSKGVPEVHEKWKQYLRYLAIGINNIRMLFDCKVIVGGYVGAYIQDYMGDLRRLIRNRNMFDDDAESFLVPCTYKVEAIAAGAALPYVKNFIEKI